MTNITEADIEKYLKIYANDAFRSIADSALAKIQLIVMSTMKPEAHSLSEQDVIKLLFAVTERFIKLLREEDHRGTMQGFHLAKYKGPN